MVELTEGRSLTLADLQKLEQAKRAEYKSLLNIEWERAAHGTPMTYKRADYLLYLYNDSYERLGEVVRYSQFMARRSWLKLLGEAWDGFDNIWQYQIELALLLPPWTCQSMMTEGERERWRGLPARVTIHRGCSSVNAAGLSWSLDPTIAAKFPTYARYRPPEGQPPQLITATVARSRIVAVKLDREEYEVIACHARPVSVAEIG